MSFMTFDSDEEMQGFLAASEEAANQRVAPQQRAIGEGDYWVRFYRVVDRLIIFGQVHHLTRVWHEEVRLGATEAEADYVVRHAKDRRARGYVFGTCYSIIEPEGELGDTHVSEVWPITAHLFDAAKAVRWNIDRLPDSGKKALEQAYQEYGEHVRRRG